MPPSDPRTSAPDDGPGIARVERQASDTTDPYATVPHSDQTPATPISTTVTTPAALPGHLGPYRILKELGGGGMGIVYVAEDTRLDRRVALKVMRPEIAAGPQARARFLREAKTAAAVEHDHIVTVYEVNETAAGDLYLAMPLLQGETLDDRLRRTPPLTSAEILRIGAEIAAGLAAAHAGGLIHRDVKPSNVWLERRPGMTDRVKVLDFGLARPMADSELSQSGAVAGTPSYMSPEQGRGEKLDNRSDLFSFGCVLYRMATGQPPFQGDNALMVIHAIQQHQPARPAELRADLPADLDELIMRLLAKPRDERPASAEEVSHVLRLLAQAVDPVASRSGEALAPTAVIATTTAGKTTRAPGGAAATGVQPPAAGHRAYVVPVVGAVVVLVAVLVFVSQRGSPPPDAAAPAPSPGTRPAAAAPARPPLKGTLDVVVARGIEGSQRYLKLSDPDALPLRPGRDHLRIEAKLSRPAYLYIVWIDTEGKAGLLYPWDEKNNRRPGAEQPQQELYWPSPSKAAQLGGGPPGMETLLLLARDEKLPPGEDIDKLFAGLKPQPSQSRQEVAWFENGLLVRADHEVQRGKPRIDQQAAVDDSLLQTQALLQSRLKALFPYSRAVCFANAGDR